MQPFPFLGGLTRGSWWIIQGWMWSLQSLSSAIYIPVDILYIPRMPQKNNLWDSLGNMWLLTYFILYIYFSYHDISGSYCIWSEIGPIGVLAVLNKKKRFSAWTWRKVSPGAPWSELQLTSIQRPGSMQKKVSHHTSTLKAKTRLPRKISLESIATKKMNHKNVPFWWASQDVKQLSFVCQWISPTPMASIRVTAALAKDLSAALNRSGSKPVCAESTSSVCHNPSFPSNHYGNAPVGPRRLNTLNMTSSVD